LVKSKKIASISSDKDAKDKTIIVNNRKLELSNINKIYWPDEKITKGQLIQYYESMADYILPYLKDRPLSLLRNPNGIQERGFFHKNAGDIAPNWMTTAEVYSESNDKTIRYLV